MRGENTPDPTTLTRRRFVLCATALGFVPLVGGAAPPRPSPGQQPRPADDTVERCRDVSRKAVVTAKPNPRRTDEARAHGVVGTVALRAVLHSSGEVKAIEVVRGLPGGLTEAAVAAAREMKFEPAVKNGRPVSQYVRIEYNFRDE